MGMGRCRRRCDLLQFPSLELLYRLSDAAIKMLININACSRKGLQCIGTDVSSDQGSYAQVSNGLSCLYPYAA
jgi:hypothetical protein